MILKPGDVFFTQAQDGGWISRQINWWSRTWGEPPSQASHVGLIQGICQLQKEFEIGKVVLPEMESYAIIEQTYPYQRASNLFSYLHRSNVFVYRRTEMSDTMRSTIMARAKAEIGKRYGLGKIILFLLDAAIGKIISLPIFLIGKLFRRKWKGLEFPILTHLNIIRDYVCSQTVAKYYWEQGIHFGGSWLTRNPDNMLDWIQKSNNWELVYTNTEVKK